MQISPINFNTTRPGFKGYINLTEEKAGKYMRENGNVKKAVEKLASRVQGGLTVVAQETSRGDWLTTQYDLVGIDENGKSHSIGTVYDQSSHWEKEGCLERMEERWRNRENGALPIHSFEESHELKRSSRNRSSDNDDRSSYRSSDKPWWEEVSEQLEREAHESNERQRREAERYDECVRNHKSHTL